MKILVACEESQEVCKRFRNKGHEAYSCDVLDCSGGHNEWHIKSDVLPLLNGNCTFRTVDGVEHHVIGKWDMIIAFPPCTHLAVSGARHFEKKRADGRQREGIEFFCKFLKADCDKIVIENPVNIISGDYVEKWFPDIAEKYGLPIAPNQRIHPWMFGDNYSKNTCLWIKGLPLLVPKVTEEPEMEWIEWTDRKTGRKKRQNKWCFDALKNAKTPEERSMIRSKTFPGIAQAMADQWG
ncbi:MAG TPA: DNA cytosine methyltransferase [Erysipelotrichaceae bacterium]|nr:DNA cytosine methyltransferase [Erysipelotrichaceae bacterium]